MNANTCKSHAELPVSFLNPQRAIQKTLDWYFPIFRYFNISQFTKSTLLLTNIFKLNLFFLNKFTPKEEN